MLFLRPEQFVEFNFCYTLNIIKCQKVIWQRFMQNKDFRPWDYMETSIKGVYVEEQY